MPDRPARIGQAQKRIGHAPSGKPSRSGEAHKWRSSSRYYAMRDQFFRNPDHHNCQWCGIDLFTLDKRDRVIHHHVDHRGNYDLYWDMSNWRPACASCHNRHTASNQHSRNHTNGLSYPV